MSRYFLFKKIIIFAMNLILYLDMVNNDSSVDLERIFDKYPLECKVGHDFMFLNNVIFLNNDCSCLQKEYYIDIFLQEGEMSFELEKERFDIAAPAVLFIPRDKSFSLLNCSENILVNIFIIKDWLRESLFDDFMKDMSVIYKMKTNPVLIVKSEDVSPFIYYVHGVRRIVSDTLNPFRLKAVQSYIESFYYQYFYKIYPFAKSKEFSIVNEFLELVDFNFIKHKNISFYANRLGVSRGYLDFLIKKELGDTTKGVVEKRILNECKQLLKGTNDSIKEIAEKMEFSSIESFSRFFKRVAGVSPSKLRK